MGKSKTRARSLKDKYGEDYFVRLAAKAQKSWKENGRKPRGFAAMSPEQRKAVQAKALEAKKKNREDRY